MCLTRRFPGGRPSWLVVGLAIGSLLSTAAQADTTNVSRQSGPAVEETAEPVVSVPAVPIDDHHIFAALEKHIDATMADGNHVRGILLGYDPTHLIVENPTTRQRYKLDRQLVEGLIVVAAPPPISTAPAQVVQPPQAPLPGPPKPPFRYRRRTGALVTGSILTGVGTLLSISAIVLYSNGDWFSRLGGTMTMVVALGHLGPGIPLVVVGAIAHRRYNEWARGQAASIGRRKPKWQPQFNVGRDAFSAGLQMQF